jgi:hypothetical protein
MDIGVPWAEAPDVDETLCTSCKSGWYDPTTHVCNACPSFDPDIRYFVTQYDCCGELNRWAFEELEAARRWAEAKSDRRHLGLVWDRFEDRDVTYPTEDE